MMAAPRNASRNTPRPGDTPRVIAGREWWPAWCYFGYATGRDGYCQGGERYGEAEYLEAVGVIDDAERNAAGDDRGPSSPEPRRYIVMANDEHPGATVEHDEDA